MMWRIKTLLLLLLAQPLFGAAGDILGAWVETNGWLLRIRVDDMFTNGTYTFGFLTNTVPSGTNYCMLSVTRMGYTTNGVGTTVTDALLGMHRLRHPYPDVALFEDPTGDDVDLRVVLSDYIYKDDSNITLTLSNAFYVTGSTSSAAAASIVVTNNSTNAYPLVIANNAWPPYELCTSNTYRARMVGYHAYARNGRQLACVRFVASDGTDSITNFVTSATCDTNMADAKPVEEYVWDVPASSLKTNQLISVNWTAYPWVGDASSICDTMDGAFPTPSTNYCTNFFLNDFAGTYGRTFANVDATNGNDMTGQATTNTTWTTNFAPFQTVVAALSAIQHSNFVWHSRSNIGASKVFLNVGRYNWPGVTTNSGIYTNFPNLPLTHAEITVMPHMAATDAVIEDGLGTVVQPKMVRFTGISVERYADAPNRLFHDIRCLWLDLCRITSADTYWGLDITNQCFTRNTIHRLNANLIAPTAGASMAPWLIRGNTFALTNQAFPVFAGTCLGNKSTNIAPGFRTYYLTESARHGPYRFAILANNHLVISNTSGASVRIERYLRSDQWRGAAIVQNIVEQCGPSTGGLTLASESSTTNIFNVLIYHNDFLEKVMEFYNDMGSVLKPKYLVFQKNNIMSDINIKSDDYIAADGARVGNWTIYNGVGCSGNHFPETATNGAPGEFVPVSAGLYSQLTLSGTTTNALQGFSNRNDHTMAATTGNGDYHLTTNSLSLTNMTSEWLLAYDLDGNARSSGTNAPGVFVYPTPTAEGAASKRARYRFRWGF